MALEESDSPNFVIYCVPVHSLRVDSRKIKKHVLGFHRWARRQEVLSESCPVSSFLDAGCEPQSSTLCPWFLGNITVLESCPLHIRGSQSCISTEIYTHIQTHPVCGVGGGGESQSHVQALALFIPDPSSLYCLCPHQLVSTMQSPVKPCLELGA